MSSTTVTSSASPASPPEGVTAGRNLITDYYDRLPSVIERVGGDTAPSTGTGPFSPGFALPELDAATRRFYSVAEARWRPLGEHGGHRLRMLDLTCNPGTQTTKTLASLLIVARAVEYARRTGERVLIFSPTSANKGTALRDAVLRAYDAGLVTPDQLRVVVLAPRGCQDKWRDSRLATDPELRRLNPMLRYDGPAAEDVKQLGRDFVAGAGAGGERVWFSLELRNYLIADAARAFFEHDVEPTAGAAPRVHAHAVSSAYGLLGYNVGRDLLEDEGLADPADRPGFLLVQHLGAPDMVLSLHRGSFERSGLPDFGFDEASGLWAQHTDPRFPLSTYDPGEVLDPTFYTHCPPTSAAMNALVERHGGGGIVVSLAECLQRYPALRRLFGPTGRPLPDDPRTLLEWSLVMAGTGVLNAIDRGLVRDGADVVVHASGSYAGADYDPIDPAAVHPVRTVADVAAAVAAGAAG